MNDGWRNVPLTQISISYRILCWLKTLGICTVGDLSDSSVSVEARRIAMAFKEGWIAGQQEETK